LERILEPTGGDRISSSEEWKSVSTVNTTRRYGEKKRKRNEKVRKKEKRSRGDVNAYLAQKSGSQSLLS
jgi:hypothetical protein